MTTGQRNWNERQFEENSFYKMSEIKKNEIDWSAVKIAIVGARWNPTITDQLVDGAVDTLSDKGVTGDNIRVIRCPGSYEIPLTCKWVLDEWSPDGVIAIGAVIRGDTPHFDYVCDAVNHGVLDLNMTYGKPVAFGVLTTDNFEQALKRANGEHGNKGAEAALALCDMLVLKHGLGGAGT